MIEVPISSKNPSDIKQQFFINNKTLEEINDKTPSNGDFFNIGEDDEVWIMQLPKGTDVSLLQNNKIKLPGRSNQNELETIAIEHPQPILHAFGLQNNKGHNHIKIVPIQGNIVLRSHLKAVTLPEEIENDANSKRVPMPTGIKERHPLHGVDYESKLKISPEIAERLKQADNISLRQSSKKSSKSKKRKTELSTIVLDSDEELSKSKSKKKKQYKVIDVDESPKKKKKKKNSVSEDLQWIQNL